MAGKIPAQSFCSNVSFSLLTGVSPKGGCYMKHISVLLRIRLCSWHFPSYAVSSPLRRWPYGGFALPDCRCGQECRETADRSTALRSGSLFKLRFATDTAAFAYASFAQDQQIKSNFNQANPFLPKLFLSSHSMRARWHYPVSQITVS